MELTLPSLFKFIELTQTFVLILKTSRHGTVL